MIYLVVMGVLGLVLMGGFALFLSYVVPRDLREIETRKALGLEPSAEPDERDAVWGGAFDEDDVPDDDVPDDDVPEAEEPSDPTSYESIFGPAPEELEHDPPTV